MSFDADAQTYITAVETADAQSLPRSTRYAINDFVVGCKSDGIWTAIKAACFLAGPRTLAGALTPLVGTAPTNVGGNFVASDYNAVTGLVGNASTKYLNSNRAANADPQNSHHLSAWITANSGAGVFVFAGVPVNDGIGAALAANFPFRSREQNFSPSSQGTRSTTTATGFVGLSRSSGSSVVTRVGGSNETLSSTSFAPHSTTYGVFARRRFDTGGVDAYTASRLAWYSIGEAINLALLDARLTTYMTAIATPTNSSASAVHFFTFGY